MNHMESLHTHTLLLTLVSPVSVTPHVPWPQTKQTWERIREHILKGRNTTASARARHDLEDFLPSPDSLAVYPELTLVTYLHALHFQPMNAPTASASSIPPAPAHPPHPQPFNYIAVTAPPCAPSALWIDAYNARHAHRGDGLRFDIALAPYVHWNTAGAGRRGWRWVPLPAVPGNVVDGVEANAGAAMRVFGRGGRGAEERIVGAAWDAYAMMAGGCPFPRNL
ncbi:hypothetical protein BJ912DRAFT_110980 [Pholiota molesta]|nr:hypothetical protein BJ912DRAFT_110980 [Pholiota molesta]